ncbi:MAG: tetratricopeptide repeat protein [Acidobacteria bacterium]|nr:tetratricopeptide repeat protein [Acidobacteriota bacterium]
MPRPFDKLRVAPSAVEGRAAVEGQSNRPDAPLVAASRALNEGRYDEVDALLKGQPASDPLAATLRARALSERGRYADALTFLERPAADAPTSDAALELGFLQFRTGRRAEAEKTLAPILLAGQTATTAAALTRTARALHLLGESRPANDYFLEAARLAPKDPAVQLAFGELFLTGHDRENAAKSFQDALSADGTFAAAYLGLARALAEDDGAAARKAAERALQINPSFTAAQLFMAELAMDDGKRADARSWIDKALAVNPNDPDAFALLAALAVLEGRQAEFNEAVKQALAVNPLFGEVYRIAGLHAARNYRFEEAAALARRAIGVDKDNTRAYADLGMHLLRTGDEETARQALEHAFRADPFDMVTFNLLEMLDKLDKFTTMREGSITVKLDPAEAPIMREYVMPLAQEALKTLSARYQFTPRGPILVEVFPKHDDFAVRNVGLMGMIGALGACFGRVVTMDSPRARPPGDFNWGATLWHELAHVITLQMSGQRVPRWLTEGISVFEEKRARPEWGREMDVVFAQALDRGGILSLRDLNSGFTNPQTISLAYYEASLLVEHLIASFGEPALHKLLYSFRDGRETEEAIKQVYGVSLDQLQTTFSQFLEKTFAATRAALRVPDGLALGSATLEELKQAAATHPGSFPVQLSLGFALRKSGDAEGAIRAFEKAIQLVPRAVGEENAYRQIFDIAREKGDTAKAVSALEGLLAVDHTDVQSARDLAAIVDADADPVRARLAYDRVVAIDPFDAGAHVALGRLAFKQQEFPAAVREFRAALAGGTVDLAEVHCDLSESYLKNGDAAQAKREAVRALEIAPTYERAQELLLQAMEGRR